MKVNERIEKFLELQNKDVNIDDIAKELGITTRTLKSFLSKNGYKLDNGKYVSKEEGKAKKITKRSTKKSSKPKKDRKINLTQEDMDKLCEVYDWYLQVKDNKNIKPKKTTSKKDINIEEKNLKDLKSTSIRVDKNTWEDFERLCSNSQFTKQEIITQALKDFMKEYKNLL